MRARVQERERKKNKYKDEAAEARMAVEGLQKENKALKDEIGEMIFGAHKDFKKKKPQTSNASKKPVSK